MSSEYRNNYISIAKAIGIILMVIGHSGCPSIINRFIYMFHMPLFFVCSGYFFKEVTSKTALISFYKKRIKGLYVPYLKWSILFLLFHNTFLHLNIYNSLTHSYPYLLGDYVNHLLKLFLMTDYELLIRPFWFIKELLYSSIIVSTISMVFNYFHLKIKIKYYLITTLFLSILSKLIPTIPLLGDSSILFICLLYFYTGILINRYKYIITSSPTFLVSFALITLIGSFCFIGNIDMRYTTIYNIIPYYILSISGIMMIFGISKKLEESFMNKILYYIGNHTFYILALNLLALKLGNLIKICIYDMPIELLSSYTIITEHNSFFWIIYSMIGTLLPLLIEYNYKRFVYKLKNLINYLHNTKN